ncbi:phage tail sheath C-terminal domain-containing protein [Streptomyces sp. NPDC047123]|uniref:phage tail sheath family protein n=1 Tax=Streptomyces sp. NPDC047123 TaxID=3155622 RepID=UPI0033F58DBA
MSQQQPNPPRIISTAGPFGPGVRFREADGARGSGLGAPVIRGVHTSIAAFVGDARGLPGRPAYVRHPQEFIEAFSHRRTREDARSHVHDAVLGHFRNGGGGVWVIGADEGAAAGTAGEGDRVAAYRSALARLARLPEITLVVAPDLWRVPADTDGIAREIAGHCARLGDRVGLLHTRQGLAPADVRGRPFELAEPEAQFVAVHYPWLTVTEPGGAERLVPPSGHVSGLCCRVDTERGVHAAPVGALVGVVKQEWELTDQEQGAIAEQGLNGTGFVAGQGIRVSTARTLSTESGWSALAVRRLVNHARASLRQGTWWAAHESNTAPLRALVCQSATAFLRGLWRQGALPGASAAEAFEVVCDETNNSAQDTARGRLNLDVGLATVRSAGFVTFRIQHDAGHRTP